MRLSTSFANMTVDQIFEGVTGRKTVWTKRGDEITKREVSIATEVQPKDKIKPVEKQEA
jgi:hypothetical protein